MIKSTLIYSGLELVAEVGGYVGLFLGVSFNQITILISHAIERIQNYQWNTKLPTYLILKLMEINILAK